MNTCDWDGDTIDSHGGEHYWHCDEKATVTTGCGLALCEEHYGDHADEHPCVLLLTGLAEHWLDAGRPSEWSAPTGEFVHCACTRDFDYEMAYCLEIRSAADQCDMAFVYVQGCDVRWVEWATHRALPVFDPDHEDMVTDACVRLIGWARERLHAPR